MTTHQYLNQIYWLQKKIDSLALYEERLREETEQISSPPFDRIRVTSSGTRDASAIIARIADCEAEALKLKVEMITKRNAIVRQIQGLEDIKNPRAADYIELLMRRYVLFEKFTKIADQMHYTEKHIFRLRNAALAAFERKYGDEYVDA